MMLRGYWFPCKGVLNIGNYPRTYAEEQQAGKQLTLTVHYCAGTFYITNAAIKLAFPQVGA